MNKTLRAFALGIIMAHTVVLTWVASTDTVDGYNVYRGTATGTEAGPPLNGSTLVTDLTYTDLNPLETDFYVVRASKGGVESVNSNEIEVTLPVAPPTGLTGVAH